MDSVVWTLGISAADLKAMSAAVRPQVRALRLLFPCTCGKALAGGIWKKRVIMRMGRTRK